MSEIIVYTVPGCPFCNKLKSILKDKNIPFKDLDITKDKEGAKGTVQKEGHIPTPQVDVKGRVIYDYTTEEALVEEIQKLLKQK
ncbi:MAG: glutaredoxin domain-containing protein [Nanoarchaeota archaeon]